ncbi:MAG TPA: hypothetical protein VF781_05410 [Solirubrobacteraceae bacterium]
MQIKRLAMVGSWIGAALMTLALLVPATAGARSRAVAPGHIRGVVTANTRAGRALRDRLQRRGAAGLSLLGGSGNLQYNGGPVMHSDANYAIYWEPSGYSTSATYKSIINSYFSNVGAASGATTNDYSVTTQYYDSAGNIAYSASNGGSTVDTTPYPSSGCIATSGPCINDAQLQTEIQKVVAAHGWPTGTGAMYYVYLPPNVTTCTDITSIECSGTVYCAYHSSMGSGSGTILYANMPYDGVSGCESGQAPNGDAAADAELNVTSHENIEAITDPLGTAWYDASGNEIGDKCNFTFGSPLGGAPGAQYNEQISSGSYYLQEEWSNASSACVQRM